MGCTLGAAPRACKKNDLTDSPVAAPPSHLHHPSLNPLPPYDKPLHKECWRNFSELQRSNPHLTSTYFASHLPLAVGSYAFKYHLDDAPARKCIIRTEARFTNSRRGFRQRLMQGRALSLLKNVRMSSSHARALTCTSSVVTN